MLLPNNRSDAIEFIKKEIKIQPVIFSDEEAISRYVTNTTFLKSLLCFLHDSDKTWVNCIVSESGTVRELSRLKPKIVDFLIKNNLQQNKFVQLQFQQMLQLYHNLEFKGEK